MGGRPVPMPRDNRPNRTVPVHSVLYCGNGHSPRYRTRRFRRPRGAADDPDLSRLPLHPNRQVEPDSIRAVRRSTRHSKWRRPKQFDQRRQSDISVCVRPWRRSHTDYIFAHDSSTRASLFCPVWKFAYDARIVWGDRNQRAQCKTLVLVRHGSQMPQSRGSAPAQRYVCWCRLRLQRFYNDPAIVNRFRILLHVQTNAFRWLSWQRGPRHLAFHPTLPVLYTSDEQSNSVSRYHIDPNKSGALSHAQSEDTVPAECTLNTNVSEIRVSGDGLALFCSNRGHDTVATFQLAGPDGALLHSKRYKTQHIPQAIELTPDSTTLYAAGGGSTGTSFPAEVGTRLTSIRLLCLVVTDIATRDTAFRSTRHHDSFSRQ